MNDKTFHIQAKIDANAFWQFAIFDNLRLRRAWRSPLLFAFILTVFAVACFALKSRSAQAPLLGGVLLAVGLGLPFFYFLSFFLSIRAQIKRLQLDTRPRAAYCLSFEQAQGVCITAGTQEVNLAWREVFGAYRVSGCIYLYAAANRAYLMPDAQVEGGADALWALLCQCIPLTTPVRTRDFRRAPRAQ